MLPPHCRTFLSALLPPDCAAHDQAGAVIGTAGGAAVGGAARAIIGSRMDKQAKELDGFEMMGQKRKAG